MLGRAALLHHSIVLTPLRMRHPTRLQRHHIRLLASRVVHLVAVEAEEAVGAGNYNFAAEVMGFEPMRDFRLAGLANLCTRPLCDTSCKPVA